MTEITLNNCKVEIHEINLFMGNNNNVQKGSGGIRIETEKCKHPMPGIFER